MAFLIAEIRDKLTADWLAACQYGEGKNFETFKFGTPKQKCCEQAELMQEEEEEVTDPKLKEGRKRKPTPNFLFLKLLRFLTACLRASSLLLLPL